MGVVAARPIELPECAVFVAASGAVLGRGLLGWTLTRARAVPSQGQADAFRVEGTPAYLSAFVPTKTKPPPPLAEDVFYGTPPLKYTFAWVRAGPIHWLPPPLARPNPCVHLSLTMCTTTSLHKP
ncbi:hypothetical protein HPB51_011437 [Rhipicephalus microplus]|uniref:Uncharacterized protein n=1 Tax=Rhipicephalus microplus TaxID=6941 RepID=A0A9J6EG09_RHIMP|nr:hypothetical protein HPB51_011437 [Rhipicephalus microplus]